MDDAHKRDIASVTKDFKDRIVQFRPALKRSAMQACAMEGLSCKRMVKRKNVLQQHQSTAAWTDFSEKNVPPAQLNLRLSTGDH